MVNSEMTQSWNSWYWQLRLVSFLSISGAIACSGSSAFAQSQITPDRTLGAESSVVTPNVDINGSSGEQIDGGAIRGSNLFHSFEQFNVESGRGAYFNNPDGVKNILSRVTGNNPSNIFGKLGVLGGNANLFLINPNGIIFGSNATLDVKGSFVASTANSINFADGYQFSATAPQTTPLLTIRVPIGLQLGENAGRILVQGNGQGLRAENSNPIDTLDGLQVQPDQTLALVGGNLSLEGGTLKTAGGRIELGSVTGSGLVNLTTIDQGFSLDYGRVTTFGDIQLSGKAAVDASGLGGGDIQVQGRQVTLTDGSQIEASTLGSEAGGTLLVRASDSIELIGESGDEASGLSAQADENALGVGGNLSIATRKLIVRDGAVVESGTRGAGKGGDLTINAEESVELLGISPTGFPSDLLSRTEGSGNAGNLTIKTKRLSLQDGARVFTGSGRTGQGNGGTLTVDAEESVELLGISPSSGRASGLFTLSNLAGNAGELKIATRHLSIGNGAQISALTSGQGRGGELQVRADDSVNIFGVGSNKSPSGLVTRTTREGQGGNITVDTKTFRIADNAIVDARTAGAGNGGNITVNAKTLEAVNGGQILASTFEGSSGRAGNINLNTSDSITISGNAPFKRLVRIDVTQERFVEDESANSGLFVLSRGSGNAGNLEVKARSIELDDRGELTAESNSGQGGNINLRSQDLLLLRRGSQISTNAGISGTSGDGGNISINTGLLTLAGNSNITANAIAGTGGNIQISTQGLFLSPDSNISASSEQGIDGVVEINRPDFDPNAELVILPTTIIDVSGLIAQGCAAEGNRTANEKSQFLVTGRGGLPPTPQEALNIDGVVEDWGITLPAAESQESSKGDLNASSHSSSTTNSFTTPLVEAQSWQFGDRGEVILTAHTDVPYHPAGNLSTCHGN